MLACTLLYEQWSLHILNKDQWIADRYKLTCIHIPYNIKYKPIVAYRRFRSQAGAYPGLWVADAEVWGHNPQLLTNFEYYKLY